MPRIINDIGKRATLSTCAKLLEKYQYARKYNRLSHKRAATYAILAVEREAWHTSSGNVPFNGLAMQRALKGQHRIVATLARFKQLLTGACGVMPKLTGNRQSALLAALRIGKPKLFASYLVACDNYSNICGHTAKQRKHFRKWAFPAALLYTNAKFRKWKRVKRAKQLFVRGWGSFDIVAAFKQRVFSNTRTWRATTAAKLFYVDEIMSAGYGFPGECELRLAMSKAWRVWFTRHWQWWKPNLARIDELRNGYNDYSVAAAYLAQHPDCLPQGLLTHMAGLRAREQYRNAERYSPPVDARYNWLANVPSQPVVVDGKPATIAPLQTGKQLIDTASELGNCAAMYHSDIAERECMLVAIIDQHGSPLGLGELLPNGKWGQISGPKNAKLPAQVKALFANYTPIAMRAVWVGEVSEVLPSEQPLAIERSNIIDGACNPIA